ncbi:saccharopine dehydrogenase NADP-binding domain-containing protein [Streptomyces sp. MUM 16J]|uniref:saccharopine dehydrogenase NADP-binding domain-containing protein n=1 Tax=Streptomyces sp. MUM 16J TaxID=2791988 RepID=UPI001F0379D7|nr:saccharopine dehydrogenase NADP-binding domain-containing protein [Streptomyces sp. MUM 16J]MCH0558436.1 saccharopine dehydrogenase NADP-binding domain-containing protein [Streptomyces sp. MUM 16J]
MTRDTPGTHTGEIWILGATGRIGRAVAARLAARGADIVLIGRSHESLRQVAAAAGRPGANLVATDSVEHMAAEIASRRPGLVVNALGGYAETAVGIARACMPGGHYVDLAADLVAIPRLFGLHRQAADVGSTLITGAGFGVLATEAVVVKLCEGRPTPDQVRADALASVATEAGTMGTAFAATVVDAITSGGRRIENGQMVKTRLGSNVETHALPDGQTAKSAGAPSGELLAVQRASNAPNVAVTSGLAPTSMLVRAALPLFAALLSMPPVRRVAVRQMAKAPIKAAPRPRTHSWGHVVATWPDGSQTEGWLRTDDGMDYTADVITETALRLADGHAPYGAYTPAAAFGPDLAIAAGGAFLLDR